MVPVTGFSCPHVWRQSSHSHLRFFGNMFDAHDCTRDAIFKTRGTTAFRSSALSCTSTRVLALSSYGFDLSVNFSRGCYWSCASFRYFRNRAATHINTPATYWSSLGPFRAYEARKGHIISHNVCNFPVRALLCLLPVRISRCRYPLGGYKLRRCYPLLLRTDPGGIRRLGRSPMQ